MADKETNKHYITLYISGEGANSMIAVDNLETICRRQLGSEDAFELVNINQSPDRASADNVMYTPLLVIRKGEQEKRFLGNLNNDAEVIRAVSSLRYLYSPNS